VGKELVIYLRSIAKQVIPADINHSRSLLEYTPCFERGFRGEREAKPTIICRALSKEASGCIFKTYLI